MTVRAMEKTDLSGVAAMERRCFTDPWTEEMFFDCLRYAYYTPLVVEEEGKVCGYGILIALFEDAEIANIALDIPYRGRGFARVMMEAMHEKAKSLGCKRALLEVRRSNVPAIALYEGLGYRKYGERANYYGNGEDALLMEKIFE